MAVRLFSNAVKLSFLAKIFAFSLKSWRSPGLFIKRHRVAKILLRVGDSAAIEANELGIFHQVPYFVEFILADQHAKMPLVIAFTGMFFGHDIPFCMNEWR